MACSTSSTTGATATITLGPVVAGDEWDGHDFTVEVRTSAPGVTPVTWGPPDDDLTAVTMQFHTSEDDLDNVLELTSGAAEITITSATRNPHRMTRMLQLLTVLLAAVVCAGCSAWHAAKQKQALERFEREWGVGLKLLLLLLLLPACSTVSVTRTASGAIHAGVTSFVGKQSITDATITTREGDTIRINGYSTANPDPETTKLIRDGVLINTGIQAAQELAQPVANGVGDLIPSNP